MKLAEIFESMEYGPIPENDTIARDWLERHSTGAGHFIGGSWKPASSDESLEFLDPTTGDHLATIAQGDDDDVDAAVTAAATAHPGWQALTPQARARYLYDLARQVEKNAQLFALLESIETGRQIRESHEISLPLVVRHLHYHAGWARLLEAEFPGYLPYGVVGQIIPRNLPLLMLAWKVAPALATGNTIVLKPSEYAPLTTLLFAEISAEIGLPQGVLNIVTGDQRTGEALVEHPGVARLSFTGSTEVGRLIRTTTAGSGKELSLTLSGEISLVIYEDADLDGAVEGFIDSIWPDRDSPSARRPRILAQEGIADSLAVRLRRRVESLRPGHPLERNADIGEPLDPDFEVMTFRTPAEAVELANNTRYGLAASIWTEDIDLALGTAAELQVGTVWVNSTSLFDAASPFGGCRESGFSSEGGREGVREYLRPAWEVEATTGRARATGPEAASPAEADNPAEVTPTGLPAPAGAGDLRKGVDAATAAGNWTTMRAPDRARIIYEIAEVLSARSADNADLEVELSIERLYTYAALADRWDGSVHSTPFRGLNLTLSEPLGVIGIITPEEAPLLGLISTVIPAIIVGNRVVVVPGGGTNQISADLHYSLEASGIPAGVVNIIAGPREEFAASLASYDDVAGVWYFGTAEGSAEVERLSAGNLKRTWVDNGLSRDWNDPVQGAGEEFLRRATRIRSLWVPYGI